MSLQASCIHCENVTEINFTVKHHAELEETHFTCDHCGAHTACFVTDKPVRDMQKDMRNLVGRDNRRDLQAAINERMAQLKRERVE